MLHFKSMGDDRGELVSLESNKNIPFIVKRIYYIFGNKPGVKRGFHAHKNLNQVAICLHGSCTFILDNGSTKETHVLNNNTQGLLIQSMVWREMRDFSPDAVLMVIASEYYSESDYIRDYNDFIQSVKIHKQV
jgi:dTDP-4-dehydrorhamnose 3,5-epimerase-like enzyme